MSTFLAWYLLLTGALAALALAAPWLVVLGLFAFIAPGLVLAMAPTAFLWGAIFAAAWWPAQALVGDTPAALVAAAATAWVLRWIPARFNRALDARVAALRADDVLPAAPLTLRGTVVLERTDIAFDDPTDHADVRRWRRVEAPNGRGFAVGHAPQAGPYPLACDAVCAALLFTPNVDAVVLQPVPEPGSVPPASSAEPEAPESEAPESEAPESEPADGEDAPWASALPEPVLFRVDGTIGGTGAGRDWVEPRRPGDSTEGWPEGSGALGDAWRLRLSRGERIRREPAGSAAAAADVTVALLRWTDPPAPQRRGPWSLAAPVLRVRRVEVRGRDGAVRLRQTAVESDRGRLAATLSAAPLGELGKAFSWAWERGRQTRGGYATRTAGDVAPVALLARWTSLRVERAPPEVVAADARAHLRALLADPAREAGDPGFALSGMVLKEIAERGPAPGDAALVAALVADRRVHDLAPLHQVVEKLGVDALPLRPLLGARLRAAPTLDYGAMPPNLYLPSYARYPRDGDRAVASLAHALGAMPPGTFAALTADEIALINDGERRPWLRALVGRLTDRGLGADVVSTFVNIIRAGYRQYRRRPDLFSQVSDDVDAARDALARLGPAAAEALAPLEQMIADGLLPESTLHDSEWQVALLRLGKPVESFAPDERVRPDRRMTPEQLHQQLRERLARYERTLAAERPGRAEGA